MGETEGWDFLLGGASDHIGGWDGAFAKALAMPDKTAGVQMAWLPGSITPWELRRMTEGQIDPIYDMETSARQAAERAKEKTKETIKNVYKLWPPKIEIIQKGYWPILLTPMLMEEMEREEQEKRKREMFT
jgi:hypothetical protein